MRPATVRRLAACARVSLRLCRCDAHAPHVERRSPEVDPWHGNVDVLHLLGLDRARARLEISRVRHGTEARDSPQHDR